MRHKVKPLHLLGYIAALLLILFIFSTVRNYFNANYESLSSKDQTVLSELDTYFQEYSDKEIWEGYDLKEHTLLMVDGRFGHAYLINPQNSLKNLFAAEIEMPENSTLTVYRIAAMTPSLFSTYFFASFSGTDPINVCGNEAFFLRYEDANFKHEADDSFHFMVHLNHEAFHNLVQSHWTEEDSSIGGRFFTESLTEGDYDNLDGIFSVMEKIQTELSNEKPDQEILLTYINEYLTACEKLKQSNPDFFNDYINEETFEGTATYIGLATAKAIGYHFLAGSVAASNGEHTDHYPLDQVIPMILSGAMSDSTLSSHWPYQTGALLCQVLDEMGNKTWQQQLNEQSHDQILTLHALIKETAQ